MAGAGRGHIVSVPPFYLFILIAQIVLVIIILGLAAYGATFHVWLVETDMPSSVYASSENPIHMSNTTQSIAAFIINGYYIVSTFTLPVIYNR